MSEKTLSELIGTLRRQSPRTTEHYACVAVLDARIRRAEAAERLAEAFEAACRAEAAERLAEAFEAAYVADGHACDDGAMDTARKQYVAARDAVRKLEEGT